MNLLDDGSGCGLNNSLDGGNRNDLIVNLRLDDRFKTGANVIDGSRTWNATGGAEWHPFQSWSPHVLVDDWNGCGGGSVVSQTNGIGTTTAGVSGSLKLNKFFVFNLKSQLLR